jgi:hypothetical protein
MPIILVTFITIYCTITEIIQRVCYLRIFGSSVLDKNRNIFPKPGVNKFSEYLAATSKFRRKNGDIKQVPCWGPTHIRRHKKKKIYSQGRSGARGFLHLCPRPCNIALVQPFTNVPHIWTYIKNIPYFSIIWTWKPEEIRIYEPTQKIYFMQKYNTVELGYNVIKGYEHFVSL